MQLSESASDHVFKQQEAPSTPELGNPLKHSPQLQSISMVDTLVKDKNQGQIRLDCEVVSMSGRAPSKVPQAICNWVHFEILSFFDHFPISTDPPTKMACEVSFMGL